MKQRLYEPSLERELFFGSHYLNPTENELLRVEEVILLHDLRAFSLELNLNGGK